MKEFANEEVYEVGKWQKYILWLVFIEIVTGIISISFKIPLIAILEGIVAIYFAYKLAEAEKMASPWLWALLQFIPLVSLLTLLHLNQIATGILRKRGIRVGLMGGDKDELEQLLGPKTIFITTKK